MWIRTSNDTIIEVCPYPSPFGYYTPSVASEFIQIPDGAAVGWILVNGAWVAPPAPPPAPSPPPPPPATAIIKAVLWYNCFATAEAIAIKRSADPVVQEFWFRLQQLIAAGETVDTGTTSVQEGVNYLSVTSQNPVPASGAAPYIAPSRVAAIIAGTLQ